MRESDEVLRREALPRRDRRGARAPCGGAAVVVTVPARGRPRTGEQARCSQRWCSEGGGGSATRWRGGGRRVRRSVGAQLRDCSGANDLIGPPSALSICRTHTPPAIARVLCAAISATPDNTRPLPPPSHRCRSGARGRCREAESPATSAPPRPVLLFSNGKLPSLDRQVGRTRNVTCASGVSSYLCGSRPESPQRPCHRRAP